MAKPADKSRVEQERTVNSMARRPTLVIAALLIALTLVAAGSAAVSLSMASQLTSAKAEMERRSVTSGETPDAQNRGADDSSDVAVGAGSPGVAVTNAEQNASVPFEVTAPLGRSTAGVNSGAGSAANPSVVNQDESGGIAVAGAAELRGDVKASSDLSVGGQTELQSDLKVGGQASLGGTSVSADLTVAGNANLSALGVAGNVAVVGKTELASLSVGGDISVVGKTDVASLKVSGATSAQALTVAKQGLFVGAPTGTNVNEGSLFVNPATAAANDTLIGAAVGGAEKFKVDASGNIYGNNLILEGSTTTSGITAATDLHVLNESTFDGTVAIAGATAVNNTLSITGQTSLTELIASGQIRLTGNAADRLVIQPTSDPSTSTKVFAIRSANGSEQASLSSDGFLNLTGGAAIGGNAVVSGFLTAASGSIDSLGVSGSLTASSASAGSLAVTGSTTLDALSAGAANLSGLTVSGSTDLGNLNVANNATVNGDLSVAGVTAATDLQVSNTAAFHGTVAIDGAAAVNNSLSITGQTSLTDLVSSGQIRLTGNAADRLLIQPATDPATSTKVFSIRNAVGNERASLTSDGFLNLAGSATIGANAVISGSLTAGSASVDSLGVAGAVTAASGSLGSLVVSGTTTLNALSAGAANLTNLTVSGTANVANLAVTGSTSLASLSVTNNAAVGGNLAVAGAIAGDGAALTNLSAANLLTGTVDNARLGSNVALLNRAGQEFTGNGNYFTAGNVGIGTTSPGARLDVAGAIRTSGNVTLTTANSFISGSTGLTLAQTGDVFGGSSLSIQNRNGMNGALFSNDSLDLVDFAFKPSSGVQQNIRYERRGGQVLSANSNGEFQIGTAANPNLIVGAGTSSFRVGNVGIGTTAPSGKLHVVAAAGSVGQIVDAAAGQSADVLQVRNGAGSASFRVNRNAELQLFNFSGTQIFGSGHNGSTTSGCGGTVTICVSGDDAGTSRVAFSVQGALAGNRLEVGGTGLSTSYAARLTTSAANVGLIIQGAASQSADLQQWRNNAGTTLTKIRNDGSLDFTGAGSNIDILLLPGGAKFGRHFAYTNFLGTAADGNYAYTGILNFYGGRIQAAGTGNFVALPVRGASGQTSDLVQLQNNSGTVLSKFDSLGNLSVGTATTPSNGVATFNGNVGIGTTAPNHRLDVNGDASVSGVYRVGGVQISSAALSNNADLAKLSVNNTFAGTFVQRNASDSIAAFQVQTAGGVSLLTIDTVNQKLVVRNLEVTGDIEVNGHIVTGNASGSTTAGTNVAAGSSASVTISGNDTAGTITITTGTGSTTGEMATVAFANAFSATPRVTLTPVGLESASVTFAVGVQSATSFSVALDTPSDSSVYIYNYQVLQ